MMAEAKNQNLFETAKLAGNKALLSFLEIYDRELEEEKPTAFLERLIKVTVYFEYLRKEDPLGVADRIENVEEFLSFLREKEVEPEFDLSTFMSELPLQSVQEESGNAVTLLTVHSAKGLEFKNLFVAGLEEGMFPHIRSMESGEDLQEERRLFYVALTRAMQRVILSWAQRRGIYGASLAGKPSRFLEEIPPWFKINRISERFGAPNFERAQSSQAKGEEEREFRIGSTVHHEKFGRGTVINVEGVPDDWKLTIRFPDGVKKILTRYAHLTREK
jgi:DNA helicase-2/ATP-dependent DNA helicase PcrA